MTTPLSPAEQTAASKEFADFWAGKGYEKGQTQPFWLSLLRVLGVGRPETFIEFEDAARMDEAHGFIDGWIPSTHVLVEQKSLGRDLRAPIKQSDGTLLTPFQQARRYAATLPYSQRPRWIVTCNFAEFHVYDMENPNAEPEAIRLSDLPDELYRLRFLVNAASDRVAREMEVSIEAGRIVGRIYDALLAQYGEPTPEILHWLNVLCVRLVFCLYAEDAGIFADDQFHDLLAPLPPEDIRDALLKLFEVLDTPPARRSPYLKPALAAFPYVNGSLFAGPVEIPQFTPALKDTLLQNASKDFDWADISPTIFGAVFESTLNPETRRSGGMHYTSIENIHKVIDPLFLDALRAELNGILEIPVPRQRNARLRAFQDKLAAPAFLDPACGSGNFLTETYLSLRRLENEAIAALIGPQSLLDLEGGEIRVKVSIAQFHGIEINDFAVSVARTALWIAESQMLARTSVLLHRDLDFLPLKSYVNIREGNALRMDWEEGLAQRHGGTEARRGFDYIIGNPPFVGARLMSADQKADLAAVFGPGWRNLGNLDYVSGWYKKAADFMAAYPETRTAFVSVNSITQGEQVAPLWKPLVADGLSIDFAHRSFVWDSESSEKAHVHCVIVGFSCTGGAGVPPAAQKEGQSTAGGTPAPPVPAWHSRHYLPHAEYRRLQAITFRLFDSVPAEVVQRWKAELRITEASAPDSPEAIELHRRIERYEDAGHGSCFLRDSRVAALVRDALVHFDGDRYRLLAWCIMPNHVHVLVEVAEGRTLSGILHTWRSYTAHGANKLLGRSGPFWQTEYYDRYIRNEEHLRNALAYIAANPSNAGLPDWPWVGTGGAGVPPAANKEGQSTAGGTPAPPVLRPLFDGPRKTLVPHINPYLVPAPDIFVESSNRSLAGMPPIGMGNQPIDGGNYLFTPDEKAAFLALEPAAEPFFHPWYGAEEFIHRSPRWCLWLGDCEPHVLRSMPHCLKRVEAVRNYRLASSRASTRRLAERPTHFQTENMPKSNYIVIPEVSSERRRYVPIGYLGPDVLCSNKLRLMPDATLWHFGILTSNVHMAWMRAVCGRMKSDYSYSINIVYNTFPWPDTGGAGVPPATLPRIETTARAILDARAAHPESTLADLYDPLTMPPDLLKAHQANDRAVMAAYGFDVKMTESDCVAALFRLYQRLTAPA